MAKRVMGETGREWGICGGHAGGPMRVAHDGSKSSREHICEEGPMRSQQQLGGYFLFINPIAHCGRGGTEQIIELRQDKSKAAALWATSIKR